MLKWIRATHAVPEHWEKDMTVWKEKCIFQCLFPLKLFQLHWDVSVMEGYVFTWYKLVYNSQEVLKSDNAHIFLSGFFFLGFPLMLKIEKKYHSTVINNAGSCSINR